MSQFENLRKKDILSAHKRLPSAIDLKYIEKHVSEEFAALIKEFGFSAFDRGFWWLTDPRLFQDALSLWDVDNKKNQVIARTAFADIFIFNEGEILQIRTSLNKRVIVSEDLSFFLDYIMCDEKYANDLLFKRMFDPALKRLGSLTETECYTFVPALPFGGVESIENIHKANLVEHLSFLAQAHE